MSDPSDQPPPERASTQQDRDVEMDGTAVDPVAPVSGTNATSDDSPIVPSPPGGRDDMSADVSVTIDPSLQQTTTPNPTTDSPVTNTHTSGAQQQPSAQATPTTNLTNVGRASTAASSVVPDPRPNGTPLSPLETEANRRFLRNFPARRFRTVRTRDTGLLCGLFAVETMLRNEGGIPAPTIRELLEIHNAQLARDVAEVFQPEQGIDPQLLADITNRHTLNITQLDNIVRIYGERWDADLRIGWINRHGAVNMVGRPSDNNANLNVPGQRMIWIHHDDGAGQGIGHWSAIAHQNQLVTVDDPITFYDDDFLAVNLVDTGVILLRSSFESTGFPEALTNTIARPIDWNTLANQRNAACYLVNMFKSVGLQYKDENGKDKTKDTTTAEDKVFLRGARLIVKQYENKSIVYDLEPSSVWNRGLAKSKAYKAAYKEWVRDQPRACLSGVFRNPIQLDRQETRDKSKKTRKSDGTQSTRDGYGHPRSLNDLRPKALRSLGDIVRSSLGVEVDDSSPERDQALVATGVGVKDLLDSGLLSPEGVKQFGAIEKGKKERKGNKKGKGKAIDENAAEDEDKDDDGLFEFAPADEGDNLDKEDSDDEIGDDHDAGEEASGPERMRATGLHDDFYRRFSDMTDDSPFTTPTGLLRQSFSFHRSASVMSRTSLTDSAQPGLGPLGSIATPTRGGNQTARQPRLSSLLQEYRSPASIPLPSTGQDTPLAAEGDQESSIPQKRPHEKSPEQAPHSTEIEITLRTLASMLKERKSFVREMLASLIHNLERDNQRDAADLARASWRELLPDEELPPRPGAGN